MQAVLKAVATAAPAIASTADKAVEKLTKGRSKSMKDYILSAANDPKATMTAAEQLVRAGLSPADLERMLHTYGVVDRVAIMQHLVQLNLSSAASLTAVAANLVRRPEPDEWSSQEINLYKQMKRVQSSLALRNADELMELAVVFNTITVTDVQKYKTYGLNHPGLGYN